MTDVIVVGGGPAGLSAALFTEKNDLDTVVFDTDETWLHKAHLYNYLGVQSRDGSQFMADAREQVDEFGVDRRQGEGVTSVESNGDGFVVETEEDEYEADYVILATGADRELADQVGCELTDADTVDVNLSMETSVDDLYATGAMIRDQEWEAIISAGDGGVAALDILSKEKGEKFHDFNVPDDVE